MFAALLIWLYIFTVFHLYGSFTLQKLCRILKVEVDGTVDLSFTVFAGLIIVTVLAMTAHLFIPLGELFVFGLTAGAIAIFIFQKKNPFPVSLPSVSPLIWGLLALLFLIVLETGTHVPANLDTGLYHAQTIRWFETYRIVPGLGNLQLRYAFNSSWLALSAALSLAFLGLRSFHLVNGAIFLIASFYFITGLSGLTQNKAPVSSIVKMIFLPLSLYLLSSEMSSLGNDMPVTLIIWVVMLLWVEDLESDSNSGIRRVMIFLLVGFAVTVKLSSLPLVFLALFIMFDYAVKKNWRSVLILGVLGGLILLPWMVRSVFLSGYPIFPQLQLDIFSVDWKMPADQVQLAYDGIVGLARIGNSWRPSMEMDFWHWAPRWFGRLTLNRQAIFGLAMISPAIILMLRRKYASVVSRNYLMAFFTVYIGMVFWFFSAPDIRFGYGFLISACMLALAPLFQDIYARLKGSLKFAPKLILLLLLAFQAYILLFSIEFSTLTDRLLLPADYQPSRAQKCELNEDVTIYCRIEGELWTECQYDLFPCISIHHPNAEMRGPTFQEGFRAISSPNP